MLSRANNFQPKTNCHQCVNYNCRSANSRYCVYSGVGVAAACGAGRCKTGAADNTADAAPPCCSFFWCDCMMAAWATSAAFDESAAAKYTNQHNWPVRIITTPLGFCLGSRFLDQELTPYHYSSCCCSCWGDPLQKTQGFVIPNRIRMKFGRIALQVSIHGLMTDFWYDVILSRWHPGHHTEKCCYLVSEHRASAWCLCTSICQFLIYSTFTLVC